MNVLCIEAFRQMYSTDVVDRLKDQGIAVSHDPASDVNSIPLPATLTNMLGERLSEYRPGAYIRLYSDYPFPWRKDGGPRDDFERLVLQILRENPERPFYRFEEYKGRRSLRYAVADLVQASCVSCHNTDKDSPNTD